MNWGPFDPYDGLLELSGEDAKWVLGGAVVLLVVGVLLAWVLS